MFDQATRLKLRFETNRGLASTEDLWDLPLSILDVIAVKLHRQLKQSGDELSFVRPTLPKDTKPQLMFDIVKHIIDVKIKERDEAAAEQDKSEKKQKLLSVLARKQDAELEGKTPEELTAMINSL